MRILFFSSYYKPAYVYGGPVRSLSSLCESLVRLGEDVEVFSTNANGRAPYDIADGLRKTVDGVPVTYHRLLGNGFSNYLAPSLFSSLRASVKQFDLVVIQTIWSFGAWVASEACRAQKVPYIIIPRGLLLPWSMSQRSLKKTAYMTLFGRRMLSHAAAVHCTDEMEADAIAAMRLKFRVMILPNGLDTAKFGVLPRGALRRQHGIPDDARVMLFLGRIHPKKRPDIAVQVFNNLKERYPDLHLVIAGPDDLNMRASLEQICALPRIHYTGLLDTAQVQQAYVDADLFLMPSESQSENFGMSALEAMASGKAVVVSRGIPLGRAIEQVNGGRWVDCSADAFTAATAELLADPAALADMGRRCRTHAVEKYDIDSIGRAALREYRALLGQESR